MKITQHTPPQPRGLGKGPEGPPPQKELEVKPELENIADRYNGSRTTGNYVSGILLGAAEETVATTAQSPLLAYEIVENLWQAETIGYNLKILGTLAAIPGAALSIPLAPFYGAWQGAAAVRQGMRENKQDDRLLTNDASNAFATSVFPKDAPQDAEPRSMTGQFIQSLEELGAKKLEPNEKPFDVPLLSPLFAVTGGVVSAAISGVVGLVAGVVAGGITTAKEMGRAFTAEDKSLGARVGQFVAAPLNLVVMGPALAWNGLKEATPRGFVDGWKHGPVRPIVDTAKASAALSAAAIQEAWSR
jgi:hypothetical protein